MKQIGISDITLREYRKQGEQLSFREKVETAKALSRIGVNVIETAKLESLRTDTLFLHTIAPLVGESVIACPVGLSEDELRATCDALKCAKHPRVIVSVPTSTVQMEFLCHKKPKAMLEALDKQLRAATALCADVEFAALDATRSEPEFLSAAVKTAIDAGVGTVTLCDSAGAMLPEEFAAFVRGLYSAVPELSEVSLSVECSDKLAMGVAIILAAIGAGAVQIKCGVCCKEIPELLAVSNVFRARADALGITSSLKGELLEHTAGKITEALTGKRSATTPFENGVRAGEDFSLARTDDINTVSRYVSLLGYELSEEDLAHVYERFLQLAEKKHIGAKELDAIVASSALQVRPTYTLTSYVINSGNVLSATANIELTRDGQPLRGISLGDGPIDAAFLAIEQIVGHHYELDDFQIQAVTEGREAVGEALVKLRASGKLYSGRGISTDIIGASIHAYINALNKICFENA